MGAVEGICIHVSLRRHSVSMETVQMNRRGTGVTSRCRLLTLVLGFTVVKFMDRVLVQVESRFVLVHYLGAEVQIHTMVTIYSIYLFLVV